MGLRERPGDVTVVGSAFGQVQQLLCMFTPALPATSPIRMTPASGRSSSAAAAVEDEAAESASLTQELLVEAETGKQLQDAGLHLCTRLVHRGRVVVDHADEGRPFNALSAGIDGAAFLDDY